MTSRIYKRENLLPNNKQKSDSCNERKRNRIMNFRTTEEERQMINKRIELSGLPKQDFFITSCMHQPINVIGNVKTFDAIRKEMRVIDEHLRSVATTDELSLEMMESLRTILEILDSFYKQKE